MGWALAMDCATFNHVRRLVVHRHVAIYCVGLDHSNKRVALDCTAMCTNMCADVRVDMCIDTRIDMKIDTYTDMWWHISCV